MQKGSFKIAATFVLFFFLATPIATFAAPLGGGYGAGFLSGGQGGAGGIDPMSFMMGNLMGGGNGGGIGGGNQGGGAQIGQGLSLAGALTGNIGLMIVGQLMSMLGGLAGGMNPQKTAVDEQYVGQGQAFGNGNGSNFGAFDPYYNAPTTPNSSSAAACTSSIFIIKDTTVTPNTTKPYPDTTSVTRGGCVLAINSDTASHNVEVKKEGKNTVAANEAIAASSSHIFRFSVKDTYTICVDSVASACTTVTVK